MSITEKIFPNEFPEEIHSELERFKRIIRSSNSLEHLIHRLKNIKSSKLLERWDKIHIQLKIIDFKRSINDNWNIIEVVIDNKNKVDGDLIFLKYKNSVVIFDKEDFLLQTIEENKVKTLKISKSFKIIN